MPCPPYGVKVSGWRVDHGWVPRTPEETYDAVVRRSLPTVAVGLAALHAALAVLQAVTLDGTDRVVLVAVASATAVGFGLTALACRRWSVPDGMANPLMALAVLVVTANALCRLALTGQASIVMLAVVGAGAALLSLRWLVATVYLVCSAWAVTLFLAGPAGERVDPAVGMAAATGLAFAFNAVRRRSVCGLAAARAEAEAAAVRDHLTGLANRRGLAMVGAQIVENARRQGDAVHCIFVDVDDLKSVNDAFGHASGDAVLVAVADALRGVTRSTDVVARWGGDEFCVVGPGPGMAPLELERRVRDHMLVHPEVPETQWSPHVSAGGAMLEPWDSGTLETLLGKADQEMYLRRGLRREGPSPSPRPATAD